MLAASMCCVILVLESSLCELQDQNSKDGRQAAAVVHQHQNKPQPVGPRLGKSTLLYSFVTVAWVNEPELQHLKVDLICMLRSRVRRWVDIMAAGALCVLSVCIRSSDTECSYVTGWRMRNAARSQANAPHSPMKLLGWVKWQDLKWFMEKLNSMCTWT